VLRSNMDFYPTILGGVILGVGIALLVEIYGFAKGIRWFGLGYVIAINLCVAIVLLIWLLSTPFEIPLRGHIILWSIAIIALRVGLVETFTKSWIYK